MKVPSGAAKPPDLPGASAIRSRRAVLAGLGGGLAALAAQALGRPLAVSATHGDVHLGTDNDATTETTIETNGANAFTGIASGLGTGVSGAGASGFGVAGFSFSSHGVLGRNNATTTAAVMGNAMWGGTGVMGYSTAPSGSDPEAPAKTGVYGYAHHDASARGVTGQTTVGRGVQGIATSGIGVHGSSSTGPGVFATSDADAAVGGTTSSPTIAAIVGVATGGNTGVQGFSGAGGTPSSPAKAGVFGYAAQDGSARGVVGETTAGRGVAGIATSGVGGHFSAGGTGTALQAQGRVSFSTAGLTAIAAGAKSKTITPEVAVVAGSMVLCTLESNQAGLLIQRVTKNTTAGTFKVFLSAAVQSGKTAKVAWFVIG